MIEVSGLTKRFGSRTAVDNVSFAVQPGTVTGFLGPNGAGKSTTMRLILGLDRPTAGTVTVNGLPFAQHATPLRQVGALLDAKAVHPGRTARNHLLALAVTHGISKNRVSQMIELTGLASVADRRVGGFSLGMGQRLGIAAALLGDPQVLLFDEPVNGLDPEGVRWVRNLVRGLAAEGRTVLLSSHLMSEMAQTADHILVLGRGRLIADAPVSAFTQQQTESARVRSPQAAELAEALQRAGYQATVSPDGFLQVAASAATVGEVAAAQSIVLHELTTDAVSLEDAYLRLTETAVEYRTGYVTSPGTPPSPPPANVASPSRSPWDQEKGKSE